MTNTTRGSCLGATLFILLIIWLTAWGGCELIKKKTADGLRDEPAQGATP